MDSRSNRRLDLNEGEKKPDDEVIFPVISDAVPSKAMLRSLYQDEIETLLTEEKKLLEKNIKHELQKKLDARLAEIESEFSNRKKQFANELESLSRDVEFLRRSYEAKVKEDVLSLHLVMVDGVMTCLTKMIGDASIYKSMVVSNISGFLEKKSSNTNAIIRVSENEFQFFKKHFADVDWTKQIRIDDKLKDGQLILDDGIASHYEIGFINHLEAIKVGLIKVLHDHHVI